VVVKFKDLKIRYLDLQVCYFCVAIRYLDLQDFYVAHNIKYLNIFFAVCGINNWLHLFFKKFKTQEYDFRLKT
jgi:hypothetical protein